MVNLTRIGPIKGHQRYRVISPDLRLSMNLNATVGCHRVLIKGVRMRRMPIASAAAVLVLAVCAGSRSSVAVQFTGPEPASNSTTQPTPCALAPTGDVIVRVVVPGLPAYAMRMGGVDQVRCETMFEEIARTTTDAAGYCSSAAPLSDNTDYDFGFVPAPPLRNVRVSAGAGCNQ